MHFISYFLNFIYIFRQIFVEKCIVSLIEMSMLDPKLITRIGSEMGLKSIEHIYLNYFIDKVLWMISHLWFEGLALKGGTAIYKFYGGRRFSKDIDIDLIYPSKTLDKDTVREKN